MIQKVTHPQSIYKMLQILGILLYHIATNQLATIKSQVTGMYMIRKNTKKNETYWKLARSVYLLHTTHPQSGIPILLMFLNSDIELLLFK